MKKRLLCLLVAFCLLPLAALGDESAYLSGDDLRRIDEALSGEFEDAAFYQFDIPTPEEIA